LVNSAVEGAIQGARGFVEWKAGTAVVVCTCPAGVGSWTVAVRVRKAGVAALVEIVRGELSVIVRSTETAVGSAARDREVRVVIVCWNGRARIKRPADHGEVA
jgi:hypothetical protein